MMKEMKTGTYIRNNDTYTFKFYTDLSMFKKLKFINSVVDTVISEENYNSIIRDLTFDYMLVKFFTDVDTEEIQNSANMIDAIERFLLETNIVDIVKANAEFGLIEELNKSIDLNIEYKTGIHPNPLNEALSSILSTLERKLDSFDMNSAMEMASKFSGMTGEFTPESIVNAYMNSDMHKKNLVEIAEAKKNKKNEINIGENLGEAVRTVVKENKADDKTKAKSNK